MHTYVYRYVHVESIESNVSRVRQETAAYISYCSREGAADMRDASAESSQLRAVRRVRERDCEE